MQERNFISMLENTTPQRFLRATPFSISDGVDFGGVLSEDVFFDKFYTNTSKAAVVKNEILSNLKANTDSIVVLIGYSGCGKTTFLHYLLREQRDKMFLFDFEKGIDNQLDEPILSKLRNEFNDIIVDDIINNEHRILHQFYNMYFKESFENNKIVSQQIDINRTIQKFMATLFETQVFDDILNKIRLENDEQSKIYISEIIFKYLKDMNYMQILGLFLLWDIADDILKKDKNPQHKMGAVFCFDNMDNIDDTEKTKEFIKFFAQFHINMRSILKALDLNKYGITQLDLVDSYTYIISYRETTYAKLTEHLNDNAKFIYDDQNVSELYVKKDIIRHRKQYLDDNRDKIPDRLLEQVNRIDDLLRNRYVENNVFPLFNNSYNIAVKTTCEICEKHNEYVQEYFDIVNLSHGKFARGANGLILRLFFDHFKNKHYFEKLQLFDFHSPTSYSFSPARLILTYLNNRNNTVNLYDIYEYFKYIITPEDITEIIDAIYLLRFSEWRHLLTFCKFPPKGANGLQSQLDLYNEHKPISQTRDKYSTLEITCAGRIYLKSMSTNFEFYSSRLFGSKYAPLFSQKNLRKNPSNGMHNFFIIIDKVFDAAKECIMRLNELDERIMNVKNLSNEAYYKSNYVFKNVLDSAAEKQFHGERIIFNHIGYINNYRQYLLFSKLSYDDKIKANKFIAKYILKYIALYECPQCTKSGVNEPVYIDLKDQATLVYENPEDFNTSIETESYTKKLKY